MNSSYSSTFNSDNLDYSCSFWTAPTNYYDVTNYSGMFQPIDYSNNYNSPGSLFDTTWNTTSSDHSLLNMDSGVYSTPGESSTSSRASPGTYSTSPGPFGYHSTLTATPPTLPTTSITPGPLLLYSPPWGTTSNYSNPLGPTVPCNSPSAVTPQKKCSHCLVTETCRWRNITSKTGILCNACFIYQRKFKKDRPLTAVNQMKSRKEKKLKTVC